MILGSSTNMSPPITAITGFLLLCLAVTAATAADEQQSWPGVMHLLLPKEGSRGDLLRKGGVSCQSWRLGVETNNLRNWKIVPEECEDYIGHYMLGHLYRQDSKVVVDAALEYARSVKLTGNGKDAWVFDVDETTLSNFPYYAVHGFGAEPYNATAFDLWVFQGTAPALPESLRLFKELKKLGIKPIFLTGRTEDKRVITTTNLYQAGYSGWDKLLLKGQNNKATAVAYKSGERVKLAQDGGYRIIGNIGDQWSDILGDEQGERTFKLPDPMYYIG